MPKDPRWPLRLTQAANGRADFGEAERIAIDAGEQGTGNEELLLMREHYARWSRRSNAAVDDAIQLTRAPERHPLRAVQAAVYLSSVNETAAARDAFIRLTQHPKMRDTARAHLVALDLFEQASARRAINIPGWLSPARPWA